MTTLVNYGYLEWMSESQKYRLGIGLANLSYKVIRWTDFHREALPFMKKMVQEWDETCNLSIFDHGRALYIEVLRGHHALTIAATVGQRLPAHWTASGKLFLDYLPSEGLDAILSQPLTA